MSTWMLPASCLLLLFAHTVHAQAACDIMCTCLVAASLPLSPTTFSTTDQASAFCTCCGIQITGSLDLLSDAHVISPVSATGPFRITTAGVIELCKPLVVQSDQAISVEFAQFTVCASGPEPCRGAPFFEDALVTVRGTGAVGAAIAVHDTSVSAPVQLAGVSATACYAGLDVSCGAQISVHSNVFSGFAATAVRVRDCVAHHATHVSVYGNTVLLSGAGDLANIPGSFGLPVVDLRGEPAALARPQLVLTNNVLASAYRPAYTPVESDAFATALLVGAFDPENNQVEDNQVVVGAMPARAALRFDPLVWTWSPSAPVSGLDAPRNRLRHVWELNHLLTARLFDVAWNSAGNDAAILPENYCSDGCPLSPYLNQTTTLAASTNIITTVVLSEISPLEYTFTITAEADRPDIFPMLYFDPDTPHTEFEELDTCALLHGVMLHADPLDCEFLRARFVDTIAPGDFSLFDGWNVTRLAAQGAYQSRWTLVRTFTLSALLSCAAHDTDEPLLAITAQNAPHLNGSGVEYAGTVCLSYITCNGALDPAVAYHYVCTPFQILLQNTGSVLAQISTGVINTHTHLLYTSCPLYEEGLLLIAFSTEVENEFTGINSTLRNITLNHPAFSVLQGGGTECTAITPPVGAETHTKCLQTWVVGTAQPGPWYNETLVATFEIYVGAAHIGIITTLTLTVNITCPLPQVIHSNSSARMQLFRDRPHNIPYNAPTDPPFIAPNNAEVCLRVDSYGLANHTANETELVIELVLLCMSTTSAPILPYNPMLPFSSGCLSPGTEMLTYVIYDVFVNSEMFPGLYNATVYRRVQDLVSSASACFNASVAESTTKCAYVQVFYRIDPLNTTSPQPAQPPQPLLHTASRQLPYNLVRSHQDAYVREWAAALAHSTAHSRAAPAGGEPLYRLVTQPGLLHMLKRRVRPRAEVSWAYFDAVSPENVHALMVCVRPVVPPQTPTPKPASVGSELMALLLSLGLILLILGCFCMTQCCGYTIIGEYRRSVPQAYAVRRSSSSDDDDDPLLANLGVGTQIGGTLLYVNTTKHVHSRAHKSGTETYGVQRK